MAQNSKASQKELVGAAAAGATVGKQMMTGRVTLLLPLVLLPSPPSLSLSMSFDLFIKGMMTSRSLTR